MSAGRSSEATVDRSRPPRPETFRELELPPVERFRLSSGVRVRVLERPRLPEVSIRLAVDAGAVTEAPDRSGVAELTGRLLTEGADGRSAMEVAEWLDRLGAGFSATVTYDAAVVSMHLLEDTLAESLDFLRSVVRDPAFEPEEVERIRDERLDEIERDRDEPDTVADETLVASVYGSHPYGRPSDGLKPTVESLDDRTVRSFHGRRYGADGAALVVCGDVDARRVRRLLEERFGDWDRGERSEGPPETPDRPVAAGDTVLVDRPGSAQAEIRIGGVGAPRSTGDYFPLKVMNAVLGGLFNSRVNMNLREDKGWTYGARTGFRYRRGAGPFVASAAVETGATAAALREMEDEMRGMAERPPEGDELELAKNNLTLSLPRKFETPSQVSRRMMTQILYGLEEDYWERYRERVEAVTRDEVAEVAGRYLDPDRMVRVAVADAGTVREELEELGELEVRG